MMRDAKGIIQLVVSRVRAKARAREGEGGSSAAEGELSKGDKTKSFMPSLSMVRTKRAKKGG